jgi:hypothetical protein
METGLPDETDRAVVVFCRFYPSSRAGLDRSNTPLLLSREESSTAVAMNREGTSRYFFMQLFKPTEFLVT